ncbi:MAG: hypothetical protein A6F71_10810 [Cycloclasticus sp. symbiont of Poecilosclerida sp. M]|nr:MAG: hypothetical protein A6F71_10810 [Cycloclasticus sp. symbiont of Poecilosclerida sp. M]
MTEWIQVALLGLALPMSLQWSTKGRPPVILWMTELIQVALLALGLPIYLQWSTKGRPPVILWMTEWIQWSQRNHRKGRSPAREVEDRRCATT